MNNSFKTFQGGLKTILADMNADMIAAGNMVMDAVQSKGTL